MDVFSKKLARWGYGDANNLDVFQLGEMWQVDHGVIEYLSDNGVLMAPDSGTGRNAQWNVGNLKAWIAAGAVTPVDPYQVCHLALHMSTLDGQFAKMPG